MEPQLFSCGLKKPLRGLNNGMQTFNGAATFQLRIAGWGSRAPSMIIFLQWSRNFSVADCYQRYGDTIGANSLQWSRNFSVADCKDPLIPIKGWILPSMEPQLFSCGLEFNVTSPPKKTSLQWSRNFSVADCALFFASPTKSTNLQWSRNFSVAD